MENTRLVSILIPAYNSEKWLAEAIQSALAQTWPEKEIIVVDDGSTDQTYAIAQSYASDIVRVYSQKNSGAAAARNYALSRARGQFIQYLDADDLLAPDKIERQITYLLKDPMLLCSGEWGSFYCDPLKAQFNRNLLCRDLNPDVWLMTAWANGLMMQPAAWLMSRQLIAAAGLWDESLSLDDDGEFFTRLMLQSRLVKFVPDAKVYYRFGYTTSLSWSSSRRAHESHYRATTLSVSHLLKVNSSHQARSAAAHKLMFFIYTTYPESADLTQAAQKLVADLGVTPPLPRGGFMFRCVARVIGWRLAKKIRQPYYMLKIIIARYLDAMGNRDAKKTSLG
jgi:glycosyltransferase involved in cell wall biosynthesis